MSSFIGQGGESRIAPTTNVSKATIVESEIKWDC